MDTLTVAKRQERMARIKSCGTRPELQLQGLVRGLGYHYQKNDECVPGSPDVTLTRIRCAIFVHGCFWHRHRCDAGRRVPKSNVRFWTGKFALNIARDRRVGRELRKAGWRVLVVWECQLRDHRRVARRIRAFCAQR
jgi:DNA mismatch endonuclease, patch repair protein